MTDTDMNFEPTRDFAEKMDERDPLRSFRQRFHIPKQTNGEPVLYFTGNSLGLQPKTAWGYIEQELTDWENLGVEGHFRAQNPWMPYHQFLTGSMAEIVGAKPIETVVMNALTVNLHLLMVSFYRPDSERHKIVIEADAFPSDQYAVKSQIEFWGRTAAQSLIELRPRQGETTLRTGNILETIRENGSEIALILLGGVNYYTGQSFDMKAITRAGREAGAVVGFDLAHAAGNVELKLHDWDVDFAVWCSYKYLNSGPGGVGGVFIHERHSENPALPRFAGWWGHDKATRFLMGPDFKPIAGAEGWQLSNPPIFQMASLKASLEIFEEAGMENLVEKSRLLTGYLEFLINEIDDDRISIITPSNPFERGCQLSIRVKSADRGLYQAITARGVTADWREPDVIRAAPVPLYNSFTDVFRFVEILRDSLSVRETNSNLEE